MKQLISILILIISFSINAQCKVYADGEMKYINSVVVSKQKATETALNLIKQSDEWYVGLTVLHIYNSGNLIPPVNTDLRVKFNDGTTIHFALDNSQVKQFDGRTITTSLFKINASDILKMTSKALMFIEYSVGVGLGKENTITTISLNKNTLINQYKCLRNE